MYNLNNLLTILLNYYTKLFLKLPSDVGHISLVFGLYVMDSGSQKIKYIEGLMHTDILKWGLFAGQFIF